MNAYTQRLASTILEDLEKYFRWRLNLDMEEPEERQELWMEIHLAIELGGVEDKDQFVAGLVSIVMDNGVTESRSYLSTMFEKIVVAHGLVRA